MAQKRGKSGKSASNRSDVERSERPLRVKGTNPVKRRGLPSHLTPGNPGNSGGKKGRSGRHTKKFKAFMATLTVSPAARRAMRRIIKGGATHPFFPFAMKLASEYGHGKPQQHVDVTSKGRALEDIVGAANAIGSEED